MRIYGETVATMAVVLPLLLAALVPRARCRTSSRRCGRGWGRPTRRWRMPSATTGRPSAPSTSRCTTWPASASACRSPELLGTPREVPPTDFTIGLDEPDVVAQRAARAAHFPALKIKVGGPRDLATLEAVRGVYDGPIRVDANTGWSLAEGERLMPELVRLGVELIEQPFPAHRLADLAALQRVSSAAGRGRRERGGGDRPRRAGRRRPGRQRQAGQGRRGGAGQADDRAGPARPASASSSAAWRRPPRRGRLGGRRGTGRLGRPRRQPAARGDPYEGLELDAACRWHLSDRPGLGVAPDASLTSQGTLACGQLGGQIVDKPPTRETPRGGTMGGHSSRARSPGVAPRDHPEIGPFWPRPRSDPVDARPSPAGKIVVTKGPALAMKHARSPVIPPAHPCPRARRVTRPSSSSASAAAGGASRGPSSTTRCVPWRARRAYRDWGFAELSDHGIGFLLRDAALARVAAEVAGRNRPASAEVPIPVATN